ncbi:MAG: protein kinase [Planctomycetes bacterium]|nr:protein kinase [Planctomycetota bacterium]
MPTCPHCKAEVPEADQSARRCAVCGKSLPPRLTDTDHRSPAATVEFDSAALSDPNARAAEPKASHDADGGAPDPRLMKTTDSTPLSGTPATPDAGGSGSFTGINLDATCDSSEIEKAGDFLTDSDPRLMKTTDSTPLSGIPAGPDGGGSGSFTGINLDATCDSNEISKGDFLGGSDPRVMQTTDSTPLPDKPVGHDTGGVGSFTGINLDATCDSDQLSSDFARDLRAGGGNDESFNFEARLSNVWGDKLSTPQAPHVSLKVDDSAKGKPTESLVIKPRSMRDLKSNSLVAAEYELLEVLGEGGMGVVYSARQASVDRTVALKMLKPHMARNQEQRQKFLSEAVVTGDLDHPNIVPMYDLGTNDAGALFYAMKRVEGTPWLKTIRKKTVTENIDILLKVADAVAFAHSRGVIHRDLKPENVMLGEFGEVLVMDWGLAYSSASFRKSASITQSHSMGGTPSYMAPEMALGPIERITMASDIYLLGAILYEIVTGKPPHTGTNVSQCLFAVARNEIQPTDKSGELVDIALHAMATNQEDRHASVRDFQAAIRGYLAHSESIALSTRAEEELANADQSGEYPEFARSLFGLEEALSLWDGNARARDCLSIARLKYATCALGKGDFDLAAGLLVDSDPAHSALAQQIAAARSERDARQHRLKSVKRVAAGLVAAIVLVVTVAFFGIRIQRDRARLAEEQAKTERDKALSAEEKARIQRDRALAAEEQARAERDRAEQAKEAEIYQAYLARIGLASAKIDENAFEGATSLLDECPPALRHWEWGRLRYLCSQSMLSLDAAAPVSSVAFDAAGGRCASAGWDGQVRVWNLPAGTSQRVIPYGGMYVHGVAFSPDGKSLAAGGNDKRGYIKLWAADTGKLIRTFEGHTDSVLSLVFSRRGERLLSTSYDGTARLWDTASGQLICTLGGHSWWVWSAAFSHNEAEIITASQDGTAIVWSIADEIGIQAGSTSARRPPRTVRNHAGAVYAVAVSSDGVRVATGGYDKRALLWKAGDVQPFRLSAVLSAKQAALSITELKAHTAAVHALSFSPDGRRLATGGLDNAINIWDVAAGKLLKSLRGHAGQVRSCCFSPDGKYVLSGGHDGQVKLWDVDKYEEVRVIGQRVLRGHADAVLCASFSPDGQQVVTASRDRTAKIWNARTGEEDKTFEEGHTFLASTVLFFPDGKKLLTAAVDGTTLVWDTASGTQLLRLNDTGRSAAAALSFDARTILTGGSDKTAKLWDAANGALVRKLPAHRTEITAVALSRDGRWLFTGESSGRCNVWRADSGELAWSLLRHSRKITAAAFSPEGSRLLTASLDNTIGQWDVAAGQELTALVLKHPKAVTSLAMLPGGKVLSACEDNLVRRWDVETAKEVDTLSFAGGAISFVTASPDGRRVLAVSAADRAVHLWDNEAQREIFAAAGKQSGRPLLNLAESGGSAWAAAISPDGKKLATVGGSEARLWNAASGLLEETFHRHGAVASAHFSTDGKRIVTGSWDNSAKIWNVATGLAELKLTGQHVGYVNSAVFDRRDRWVLTASDDKTAWLWDATTGKAIRSFTGHTDRVTRAAFAPDGKTVVTASADKTCRIWDTSTGRELRQLTGHTWGVLWAEYSADGTRIITSAADNQAKIWDATSGRELITLAGHTSGVNAATLSADGKRALTASQDNTVKLWDTRTGKEILSLKEHSQEVTSVCFSPDGHAALSASRDGTVIIWPAIEWREMQAEEKR